MGRITKNVIERRQELINAAERLFLERGYERTAVNDIVKAVGVAQGTFYYHFESKTHILESVLNKNFSALERELSLISEGGSDPCAKINEMLNCMFRFNRDKKKLLDGAHLESNTLLHHKLEEMSHTRLIPRVREVVEAGVAQGRFHAPVPAETTDILFHALVHLMHEPGLMSDGGRRKRVRLAVEHLFKSVLGIDGDTISLAL